MSISRADDCELTNSQFRFRQTAHSFADGRRYWLEIFDTVDDDQDRRARAAEAQAEDAGVTGKRQEPGEHGADRFSIGLMDAIAHRSVQKIAAPLGKCESE